jgi:hypothetical protein
MSKQVMKDLMANKIRTVEIRSPQNFFSLQGLALGDRVFLTEASAVDVVPGTGGLIARANGIQIMTHRMVQSGDYFYEEVESQAIRVQLQLLALGRVRSIRSFEVGSPFVLEVDEIRYCNAR